MVKIIIVVILLFLGLFIKRDDTDWIMYPNPAKYKGYFNIEVKTGTLPSYVKVVDIGTGRVVMYKYIGEDLTFARVEIFFRPGTYVVYLEDAR